MDLFDFLPMLADPDITGLVDWVGLKALKLVPKDDLTAERELALIAPMRCFTFLRPYTCSEFGLLFSILNLGVVDYEAFLALTNLADAGWEIFLI